MKNYVFAFSMVVNLFFIMELWCITDVIKDCDSNPVDTSTVVCPCYCNDSRRFGDEEAGGGEQVSRTGAQDRLTRFHETHESITMSGAFISKHALNEMFCANTEWNGIYAYMGMNEDGTYTMIFEGNHSNHSAIRRSESEPPQFFIAQSLCPDMCGAITP